MFAMDGGCPPLPRRQIAPRSYSVTTECGQLRHVDVDHVRPHQLTPPEPVPATGLPVPVITVSAVPAFPVTRTSVSAVSAPSQGGCSSSTPESQGPEVSGFQQKSCFGVLHARQSRLFLLMYNISITYHLALAFHLYSYYSSLGGRNVIY